MLCFIFYTALIRTHKTSIRLSRPWLSKQSKKVWPLIITVRIELIMKKLLFAMVLMVVLVPSVQASGFSFSLSDAIANLLGRDFLYEETSLRQLTNLKY